MITTEFRKADHLIIHPLFRELDAHEKYELSMNSKNVNLTKDQYLDYQYNSQNYLYFIISGKLRIKEIDPDGNQLVKDVLHEGDILGDLDEHSDTTYVEYAEAITSRVLLCRVPYATLKELMKGNASFSLRVTNAFLHRYRKLETRYRSIAYLNCVKSRLVSFIKEWASREGVRDGNQVTIKNYLTHQDIASLICSTRVTVTNILNDLKSSGYISYSKSVISIADIENF
ncbi:MAG: Crp/Fnr family transcriptional regulator [Ekhidna sp.]